MRSAIIHTVLLGFSLLAASAAIVVPGANGKDGVFAPNANVTIDLRQAVPGAWDDASLESGGNGVYDKDKWAIVFRYESVNIGGGSGISFRNHSSRAPVIWLVSGDVKIDGTIDISGSSPAQLHAPAEPGPGGFRGGRQVAGKGSSGFGPAGGAIAGFNNRASGGGHRSVSKPDAGAGKGYGDPGVTLLVGGSGGGTHENPFENGGAGGGALLIAATGKVEINGVIYALGGPPQAVNAGPGAGGAIRIVCDTLEGTGELLATGLRADGLNDSSDGRIALEARVFQATLGAQPDAHMNFITGNEAVIWQPLAPFTRIVSVGELAAPVDPVSAFGFGPPDLFGPAPGQRVVTIETRNMPTSTEVLLHLIPSVGPRSFVRATHAAGDFAQSTWNADVSLAAGNTAMQVHAVAQP